MTLPNERTSPVKAGSVNSTAIKSDFSLADAADKLSYVDHFRARVLQDALTEAMRSNWLRRADAFEAAMHKPGDFPGLCSVDQIAANNERLAQKAAACRNHASICIFQDTAAICEHLRDAS